MKLRKEGFTLWGRRGSGFRVLLQQVSSPLQAVIQWLDRLGGAPGSTPGSLSLRPTGLWLGWCWFPLGLQQERVADTPQECGWYHRQCLLPSWGGLWEGSNFPTVEALAALWVRRPRKPQGWEAIRLVLVCGSVTSRLGWALRMFP